MRILFLGDIVGEPGRKSVIKFLPSIQKEHSIDFTIVNGENSAGGRGITPAIAKDLFKAGVDVITTGDHAWDQRELADHLKTEHRILRPINYPDGAPGSGIISVDTPAGKLAVLNAQGRTFMGQALENPFLILEETIDKLLSEDTKMIFLDFHAETTSEKIAMGYHLDGKASVIVGTHTHVQTADERLLPQGTAHITDAGMCGPETSVLGRNVESIIYRFKSSLPTRFPVAKGPVRLCGVVAEIDPASGKAKSIERYNRLLELGEM